jgi:hypothetical protein
LEAIGGCVEAELEVKGATAGDKVEADVGCLRILPLVSYLCGGGGCSLQYTLNALAPYLSLLEVEHPPPPPPPTH